ncbi:hypothetical protein PHSY_004842 [Pseudozyma hubeiensis SY62]|uniref:Uncharacterized protein n=1 Tax=Pseudozyma hubeiensis (strain SY62) TaxID=1305764 RepID=R9P7M2_PSEHS|nr:hypothetical protein PHSY_004842 [Pseudozyma hubeiensis SY62]GAC97257.1 hypothetical protein PHSY_004842 [Pseudozyma hubeiensis SY62]
MPEEEDWYSERVDGYLKREAVKIRCEITTTWMEGDPDCGCARARDAERRRTGGRKRGTGRWAMREWDLPGQMKNSFQFDEADAVDANRSVGSELSS